MEIIEPVRYITLSSAIFALTFEALLDKIDYAFTTD